MGTRSEQARAGETAIAVRYWASAREAAGCVEESVPVDGPIVLGALIERLSASPRRDPERLRVVLAACSVVVGDRPAGREDRWVVPVRPGDTVEFLPPFAGG